MAVTVDHSLTAWHRHSSAGALVPLLAALRREPNGDQSFRRAVDRGRPGVIDRGRTITCAAARGVGADTRCCDRVGGQRRWYTAIRFVEAALRLLGSLLPLAA